MSKPEAPPKPDPATVAVSVDDEAKRRAELERRKRGGFYNSFRNQGTQPAQTVGGSNQPVG